MNKFMFIVPNTKWFGKRYWLWFNPAISLLAPILENHGLEVKVLEANIDNLSPEQIKRNIEEYCPATNYADRLIKIIYYLFKIFVGCFRFKFLIHFS